VKEIKILFITKFFHPVKGGVENHVKDVDGACLIIGEGRLRKKLEKIACGKPCVSTSLSTGVPFVNEDGKTGIIVPPKDPQALAEAINTLLDNPALRERYGSYAKERVKREFAREAMVKKVLGVYQEVLKKQDRCT